MYNVESMITIKLFQFDYLLHNIDLSFHVSVGIINFSLRISVLLGVLLEASNAALYRPNMIAHV